MRKTFVTLSLFAIVLTACTAAVFAGGKRRGGGGSDCGGYGAYGGGGGYAYGGYGGPSYAYGGYGNPGSMYGGQTYGYNGQANTYGTYGGLSGQTYAYGNQPSSIGPAGYDSTRSGTDVRQSFYSGPGFEQTAIFTILVPDQNAELWLNDQPTQQRGTERTYQTPPLSANGFYTIKARWTENGKTVERQRRIEVRAGQSQSVDFRGDANTTREEEFEASVQGDQNNRQGQGAEKRPTVRIDGEWTVVYAEMDGKKGDSKKFTNVTIKGNVATCKQDGKEKSIRMEFGPHHMIRCTMLEDGKSSEPTTSNQPGSHTHHGVYIASQEYLSFSVNKGMDRRFGASTRDGEDGKGRDAQPRQTSDRWDGQGPYGSGIVLILRRADIKTAENP